VFRFSILSLVGLICSAPFIQQAGSTESTPPTSASPASVDSSKAVVSMEEPMSGDHWTYEIRDDKTGAVRANSTEVITDVTPTDTSMRIRNVRPDKSYGERFNIFDRSWNLIRDPCCRFQPHDGLNGIQMPLAVGKTWAFESSERYVATPIVWKRSSTSEVVAQETVTTKAGTFETFKIVTISSSRTVSKPVRTHEITITHWYAPAINHWVKRSYVARNDDGRKEDRATLELIDYGRANRAGFAP